MVWSFENSRHFATPPPGSPAQNDGVWWASAEIYVDNVSLYPDLDSTSDWSCGEGNLLQPIRSTTHIREVLLIGRAAWEICFNQSEALLWSSAWNFCAHSSDVILRGNRWWRRVMFSQAKLCPKNGCDVDYVVTKSLIFIFIFALESM